MWIEVEAGEKVERLWEVDGRRKHLIFVYVKKLFTGGCMQDMIIKQNVGRGLI